ncbi:DUF6318 family protein [Actinopolymorpha sp. B9G3]|uniref:DUF6318 family protein n=1 Tax=Actinopolymorpha sp. B9G3 TaxID=3158970 RepID=UPI0032D99C7D
MRSTAGWMAGLAVGLGLALGACGGSPGSTDEPKKDTKARPSASASPSVSASPSSAAKGADVAADDEAAAKRFVQTFLAAHDQAMADGDFSAVTAMSADECGNCQMSATYYSQLYEEGGKVEGGTFTKPTFNVSGRDDDSVVVEVKSTVSAYEIVSAAGSSKKFPAKPNASTFTLKKDADGTWHVAGWTYD